MGEPARWLRLLPHLILFRPLLRLVFGVNARGREHLEDLDQFVLAANHNSHLDTLLLYAILPPGKILTTYPVAARDYFAGSPLVFNLMNRLFRPIWVDRENRPGDALDEMDRRLAEGGSILIFPEGTRGEPGQLQEFKAGVGHLAVSHREVPVLPVHILGPERSLPRTARLPLPLWNYVTVGPPLRLAGEGKTVAASLRQAVAGLAEAEARGRHRRRRRVREAFTLAVLGIDGSGKSTLARGLARSLSGGAEVCLISDRLERFADSAPDGLQPLLTERVRLWLGRKAKQAKSLAAYKIPKLSEMFLRDRLLEDTRRWYAPDAVVMDGSPLLNLAAWAVLYREENLTETFTSRALGLLSGREHPRRDDPLLQGFPEMRLLHGLGLTRLRVPDAVIWIDLAPRTAMARIESRGEDKQVHETEEKLARLREAYALVGSVIERDWGLPYLRIDGGATPDSILHEAARFAAAVRANLEEPSGEEPAGRRRAARRNRDGK